MQDPTSRALCLGFSCVGVLGFWGLLCLEGLGLRALGFQGRSAYARRSLNESCGSY